MALLEERLTSILNLRLLGKDETTIAKRLGISSSDVLDSELLAKSTIQNAIKEGANTVGDISKRVGLSPLVVAGAMSYYQINLLYVDPLAKTYRGISRAQRIETINQAIAEGERSIEVFCRISDTKPYYFWRFCKDHNIELPPNLIPYRYRPEMDAVIDRVGTLHEIGIAGGYSEKSAPEGGRQYLMFSKQHELWKQKRKEIKQAQKIEVQQRRQELVSLLEARVAQLAEGASWPEKMAFLYIRSVKFIRQPHKKFVRFFSRYESARNRGRKSSLDKLGRPLGMGYTSPGRLVSKVGLEPFYGKRKKVIYSQEIKEVIRKAARAARFKMSGSDISYFLGIGQSYSSWYSRRMGFKLKGHVPIARIGKNYLTYRLASQIYEAQAAGFRRGDIVELLDTIPKIVRYAIDNKHQIAPKIVQVLRIIYDNPHYNRPYKMPHKISVT